MTDTDRDLVEVVARALVTRRRRGREVSDDEWADIDDILGESLRYDARELLAVALPALSAAGWEDTTALRAERDEARELVEAIRDKHGGDDRLLARARALDPLGHVTLLLTQAHWRLQKHAVDLGARLAEQTAAHDAYVAQILADRDAARERLVEVEASVDALERVGDGLLRQVEAIQGQGGAAHGHRYLSTACLHATEPGREHLHTECSTDATRWNGSHKTAASCKWCGARCVCPHHLAESTTTTEEVPNAQA